MTTGITTLIFDWCPVGFCNTSSLISDNDGNIFTAGSNLYSYNIYTGNSINYGALPANMNSAGDMTYYNGTLYLAGINNNIIQVNITDPINSQILFDFNTPSPIVGISTFYISCDSVISFGSTQLGEFYLIDIENGIVSPFLCSANGNIVYGLATPQEYLASDCTYTLDLDGDDSSGGVNGNFQYGTCVLPSPVVDTDVVLLSGYLVDSIIVDTSFHPSNGNDFPFEYLTAGTAPNITILGNGTNHLVLVNDGTATAEDFRTALLSVLYHNDAMQPTTYLESKDYEVSVWSQAAGQQLSTFFSIQYWPFPVFSLGSDTTICNGETLLLATPTQLAGTWPPYITTWQDGSNANTFNVDAPGTYTATYEAAVVLLGCTWSDTITVSSGQPISTQSSVQLCNGETFTLNGQTFTSDTTACSTFSAFSGCDSTHCTTVVFTPLLQSTVAASICQGSSFPFNGQLLTMAGTYLDTIANSNGCDTLIQLVLSVLPTSLTMLDSTVCQGGSVTVGGQFFSSPGLHTVMLPAANGCDSTVMLTLSVLQNTSANVSASICEGSSYPLGGMSFAASGNYQVTLPNWLGCDSTVNLSLTVQSAISINLDTSICEGQSLNFFGQALTQSGNYNHTATSPTACDTVYNLALSVLALPTVAISQSPNGCAASSVLLSANSNSPANGLLWSNAANGPTTSVSANGQYSVTVTDANGCSSTATTVVSLVPPLVASIETSSPICTNDLGGWIEVLGESGGISPYSFAINGGPSTSAPVFEDLGNGSYEIVVMDNSGCTWDTVINIAEPPIFQINAGLDQTIQVGAMAHLNLNSSSPLDSIWWLPTDFLDCTSCPSPTSTPDNSIEYQAFALDSNGCMASDIVSIILLQPQGSDVYAPNAFSPNGDGINDAFTLFGNEKIAAIESLTISDRWGGMVFYAEEIPSSDLSKGWTGEWRGKQANQGVYTWIAMVKLADETNKLLTGDVTLVR